MTTTARRGWETPVARAIAAFARPVETLAVGEFTILQDSNEQHPWQFPPGWAVELVPLETGDYSIAELPPYFATIERKNLDDLIASMMGEPRRDFQDRLARMMLYPCRAVVVEAQFGDLLAGRYHSQMTPVSAKATLAAWQRRYHVPINFAGSPADSASWALALLQEFWRDFHARAKHHRHRRAK